MPATRELHTFYDENKSRRKWLVLVASFVNHIIVFGMSWGAGIFQVIFMHAFGGPGHAARISVITTIPPTVMSSIGPFSSFLINMMGKRRVAWLGTVLVAGGMFLSSLATSVNLLYVTFTIFGIGCGLVYSPSVVIICDYFIKLRPMGMGLAGAGLSLGIFIFPMFIRLLDDTYGWRGACLLLAGVGLNLGVGASLFKAVECPSQQLAQHSVKTGKRKILRVKMLREIPFWCFLINQLLCMYGMMAFFLHMPAHAENVGFSNPECAFFVSMSGVASTINRLLYGFMLMRWNHPMALHMVSMGFAGLAVAAIPFLTSRWALLSASFIYGLGCASFGNTLPLILAQLVGSVAINDALGYALVAEGIGAMIGPPFSGYLFDTFGSYKISLTLAGGTLVLSSLMMIIPYLWLLRVGARNAGELDELPEEMIDVSGQYKISQLIQEDFEKPAKLAFHRSKTVSTSLGADDEDDDK